MACEYKKYNADFSAVGLRFDSRVGKLVWDVTPGRDSLLVQMGYEDGLSNRMEEFCESLSAKVQSFEELRSYKEVMGGVFVRWVSPSERARNNGGCEPHGLASSYAVFAVDKAGSLPIIYGPDVEAIDYSDSFCRVPQSVHIEIRRDTYEVGRLFKKTVESEFTSVVFPESLVSEYEDGDLSFVIQGLPRPVPITRKMLANGTVYIKTTPSAIEALSNKVGLQLI